jgi:hypothetical protein
MNPSNHQAHYALGNTLLLQAKQEVMHSPPYIALMHRGKDAFFDASQNLHGIKGLCLIDMKHFFLFINSCLIYCLISSSSFPLTFLCFFASILSLFLSFSYCSVQFCLHQGMCLAWAGTRIE